MQTESIHNVIDAIRAGRIAVLVEDNRDDSEGVLVMAADAADEASINFMAREARGLICVGLPEARCRELQLSAMVPSARRRTRFTVSIEAREGVTTGISAADRALTLQLVAASDTVADDLVQPGHIFPIMAATDGVIRQAGFAEAACDLARLAGRSATGVLVSILDEAGECARGPAIAAFAQAHGLPLGSLTDLIHHRILTEGLLARTLEKDIATCHGPFRLVAYHDTIINAVHLAMVQGDLSAPGDPPLVRVQGTEVLRDVLDLDFSGGQRYWNARRALQHIADAGRGALVLLARGDADAEILQDIERYASADTPRPPQFAQRMLGAGAQILRDLGIRKMRLMSHSVPYRALAGFELEVTEFVPFDR
ncbi:3,4-dihydroxy-2-butanone-4-phosphate synthase [Herbaspirillum sp. GCM10030257]|uniref:3,4-dihydroxy-2-butanone-4-phosphate synthase n=1 Tax=Herbaspirillum sp. GCM10030257 TaxID=3273393 RepID=UPI00361ACEDD